MTVYRVTLTDGQVFLVQADLSRPEAPISASFFDLEDGWQPTPYRTCDAGHDAYVAGLLAACHFRAGEEDCAAVSTVIEDGWPTFPPFHGRATPPST